MSGEEWRAVVGYDGSYEVSNRGRVRSLDRFVPVQGRAGRFLRGRFLRSRRSKWYDVVEVAGRSLTVHRLVLESFIGPCPPRHLCRHLDGDPKNNRLENLRWGTVRENQLDKRGHGTMPRGESHWRSELTETMVREIRTRASSGETIPDMLRSGDFPVSLETIRNAAKGKTWSHVE